MPLEDSDHLAVHCVHIFMQNLYHYATQNTVRVRLTLALIMYRKSMRSDLTRNNLQTSTYNLFLGAKILLFFL